MVVRLGRHAEGLEPVRRHAEPPHRLVELVRLRDVAAHPAPVGSRALLLLYPAGHAVLHRGDRQPLLARRHRRADLPGLRVPGRSPVRPLERRARLPAGAVAATSSRGRPPASRASYLRRRGPGRRGQFMRVLESVRRGGRCWRRSWPSPEPSPGPSAPTAAPCTPTALVATSLVDVAGAPASCRSRRSAWPTPEPDSASPCRRSAPVACSGCRSPRPTRPRVSPAVAPHGHLRPGDRARLRHRLPVRVARPDTSVLNPRPDDPTPNLAIVAVDSTREVCFFADHATDLIVDVTGWFTPSGALLHDITPVRVLDTRNRRHRRTGSPPGKVGGDRAAGSDRREFVPLGGDGSRDHRSRSPSPTESTFATAYPCGSAVPPTSTTNTLARPRPWCSGAGRSGRATASCASTATSRPI